MFCDLGIDQKYESKATGLYHPDGLRKPKSPVNVDVVGPEG